MVRRWVLILAVAVFGFSFLVLAQAQAENKYMGAEKCKLCHQSESKGNQFGKWQKSQHAQAFKTLATDKAKEFATARGVAKPQEDAKCLKCHSTASIAYNANLVAEGSKLKLEDGVQCESCHNPGEKYWTMTIMKDRDKAIANGLNASPDESVCVKCHNSESPTFTGFDFAEKKKIITHPRPK